MIIRINKSFLQPSTPVTKNAKNISKSIIMPQDISFLNRFGTKQLRPTGSRQPYIEANIIADQVVLLNGMSTFKV